MGKILLVEPRPILRQAISVALFPEHDLHVATLIPNINEEPAQQFDLIIVDSAAVSQTGNAVGAFLQKLQGRKIPTMWIEDANAGQAVPGGNIVILKTPIEKNALQSAILKCLDSSSVNRGLPSKRPARGRTTTKEARTVGDFRVTGPEIIELVDVVAEPPEPVTDKSQEIKTK